MNKKTNTILGVLLLVFCIAGSILGIWRQRSLNANHKLAIAEILDCYSGGRGNAGGTWIDYKINFAGKEFNGSSRYQIAEISDDDCRKYLLHKNFPAVYYPNNPSISTIMITPDDFARFGYMFPDSLNWVREMIKKRN